MLALQAASCRALCCTREGRTRSGCFCTEVTALSSHPVCRAGGLEILCSVAHAVSLLSPSNSWGVVRGPYFKCFLFPIQTRAGYLFPLLHLIYKKHASWVTLNKRQNCFFSVFTDNKMNLSSKQTVHNVPCY